MPVYFLEGDNTPPEKNGIFSFIDILQVTYNLPLKFTF